MFRIVSLTALSCGGVKFSKIQSHPREAAICVIARCRLSCANKQEDVFSLTYIYRSNKNTYLPYFVNMITRSTDTSELSVYLHVKNETGVNKKDTPQRET